MTESDHTKDSHQETSPEDKERHVGDSENLDRQEMNRIYSKELLDNFHGDMDITGGLATIV